MRLVADHNALAHIVGIIVGRLHVTAQEAHEGDTAGLIDASVHKQVHIGLLVTAAQHVGICHEGNRELSIVAGQLVLGRPIPLQSVRWV